MYLEHFNFENQPFSNSPNTDIFYTGGKRADAVTAILAAMNDHVGLIKVLGDEGHGKSCICRKLFDRASHTHRIIYITDPSIHKHNILEVIYQEVKPMADIPKSKHKLIQSLLHFLIREEKKPVVVFIEEAQALTKTQLTEIRRITNLETDQTHLIQLVLFGDTKLDTLLAESDTHLLEPKVTRSIYLNAFTFKETWQYIQYRLARSSRPSKNSRNRNRNKSKSKSKRGHQRLFPTFSLWLAFKSCGGSIRQMNRILDLSLMSAYSKNRYSVSWRDIIASLRTCKTGPIKHALSKWTIFLIFFVGISLGVAIGSSTLFQSTLIPNFHLSEE